MRHHGMTSDVEGWHGEGWYTITYGTRGDIWTDTGAVWYESEDDLATDVNVARSDAKHGHVATAWYHGSGLLPNEVISRNPRDWIDVDDDGLDEVGNRALYDIAEAKRRGKKDEVNAAIDRYERAVDEFNDGITD